MHRPSKGTLSENENSPLKHNLTTTLSKYKPDSSIVELKKNYT